jgi:ankyrin repeat protein
MRVLLFAVAIALALSLSGLRLNFWAANWMVFEQGTREQVLAEVAKLPEETGLDTRNEIGMTPLMFAAMSGGDPVVMRALLDAGANPNAKFFVEPSQQGNLLGPGGFENMTALGFALFQNANAEVVDMLLNAGSHVNARFFRGETALHIAVASSRPQPGVVDLLIAAGAEIDAMRGQTGFTPLHQAAMHENAEAVTSLLQAGADPNANVDGGYAVLHSASIGRHNASVVKQLLEAGADVNYVTKQGFTALMNARRPEIIQILLDAGADLETQDEDGRTALMLAAHPFYKNELTVAFLIGSGAQLEARDKTGRTALLHSLQFDTVPAALQALIDAGADLSVKDFEDRSALDYAQENSRIMRSDAYQTIAEKLAE